MSSTFRLKLCGLNKADISSLKSMLKLTSTLLTDDWSIVTKGDADLYLYSFDTDEGKETWQQHSSGLSALLTSDKDTSEAIDLVLRKPLRTKNFSVILNSVKDKIKILRKKEAQAEKARLAAEAKQAKKDAEDEKARLAAEAEQAQKEAEAEEARLAVEAEQAQKEAEAGEARLAVETEQAQKEAEAEEARLAVEAEQAQKEAEAEKERLAAEAAQAKKEAKAEKARKAANKPPSLLSGLSNFITGTKSPARGLPELNLSLPEKKAHKTDTITTPKSLKKWLAKLPENNNEVLVNAILDNIVPLNRIMIASDARLALLDLYREVVDKLMLSRDPVSIEQEADAEGQMNHLKSIRALSLLIAELAIGYKVIVNEAYQRGKRPNSNGIFLVAINRAAEYTSVLILYAYRYSLVTPTGAINTLNQLYIYCEASNTLDTLPTTKETSTSMSLAHIYKKIMLISISAPYSLAKYDVTRLYRLMTEFTDDVEIDLLSDKYQNSTSTHLLLAGHFCIDTASDQVAIPLAQTPAETRKLAQSRLFNTQQALRSVEQIFQQTDPASQQNSHALRVQLLKKVIPYINATYEREFDRTPCENDCQISLAQGLSTIHNCLSTNELGATKTWTIHNKGEGGLMVSSNVADCYPLYVGDFFGVFEPDSPPSLAIVRWLNTDEDGITRIGLESCHGVPVAVSYTPQGESNISQGLLLETTADDNYPNTLIVDRGIYSPKRPLRITEGEKKYKIFTLALIDSSFNYEQCSFESSH